MLEDELRAAKAELESGQASHRADLVEREAELEEKVRATREEFQRQLEEIEASYRSQLEQREVELHGRVTDAETAARTAVHDLQGVRDEVTAARAEAASREQQLLEAHNEIARIRGELKGHTSEVKERRPLTRGSIDAQAGSTGSGAPPPPSPAAPPSPQRPPSPPASPEDPSSD